MAFADPFVPSQARPDILDRLRRETRDLHEAIERDIDLERYLASREAYRSLLARWWGFLSVAEPAIAAALDPALFEPRRKVELLRSDLARLGLNGADISLLPLCPAKMPRTEAEALGVLYVLEGSTLGGQIIARQAAAVLGPGVPLSFYRSYGANIGAMWRQFRSMLCERASPDTHDTTVAAAKTTFVQLSGWLRHQPG